MAQPWFKISLFLYILVNGSDSRKELGPECKRGNNYDVFWVKNGSSTFDLLSLNGEKVDSYATGIVICQKKANKNKDDFPECKGKNTILMTTQPEPICYIIPSNCQDNPRNISAERYCKIKQRSIINSAQIEKKRLISLFQFLHNRKQRNVLCDDCCLPSGERNCMKPIALTWKVFRQTPNRGCNKMCDRIPTLTTRRFLNQSKEKTTFETTAQETFETTGRKTFESTTEETIFETTAHEKFKTTTQTTSLETTAQQTLETTARQTFETTAQETVETTAQETVETTAQETVETTVQELETSTHETAAVVIAFETTAAEIFEMPATIKSFQTTARKPSHETTRQEIKIEIVVEEEKSFEATTQETKFVSVAPKTTANEVPTTSKPNTTTMSPTDRALRKAAGVVQSIGCSILSSLLVATLAIFIVLREISPERVLHMNQELSLLCAHLLMLFVWDSYEHVIRCKVTSALLQFFFLSNFNFLLLESIHFYSILTNVIRSGSWLNCLQIYLFGWGTSAAVVAATIPLHEHYASPLSCWLNYDHRILWLSTIVPIIILSGITAVITEATGMDYRKALPKANLEQRRAAIMNRMGMITLLPLHFCSWLFASYSIHNDTKNATKMLVSFSVVFVLHIILGIAIFAFHALLNPKVHKYFVELFRKVKKMKMKEKQKTPLYYYHP